MSVTASARGYTAETLGCQVLPVTGAGHLLQQIHGKDPYIQVEECEALKMGSRKYKFVEIR